MEEKKFSNTELHAHSTGSICDGIQLIPDMVITAAKKGATALAITDHGNCINWLPFYNMCNGAEVDHRSLKAEGLDPIKPILGTESYIYKEENLYDGFNDDEEDNDDKSSKIIRQHLILLCKDYAGMKAISRFVSETNRNIDSKGKPIGTVDMLRTFFGKSSTGYGHVVCQSACIAGVIANPLMFNIRLEKEIGKIQRRIDKSVALLPEGLDAAIEKVGKVQAKIDGYNTEIQYANKRIEELKPNATISMKDYQEAIKLEKEPDAKDFLKKEMEKAKVLKAKAKEDTKDWKDSISFLKGKIKELKDSSKEERDLLSKNKDKLSTIETNKKKIAFLSSKKKDENQLLTEAKEVIREYKDIFGSDFYAEVQYHGIPEEAYVMPFIVKAAHEMGVKIVATNDVHMCRQEDAIARDLIRNISRIRDKSFKWSESITGDSELYFKTGKEKAEMLSQILSEDDVIEAFDSVEEIENQCNVTLSDEKHYPEYKDSIKCLRELCETGYTRAEFIDGSDYVEISLKRAGIKARYGDAWNDELQKRLDYELSVIEKMNFGSYFICIADVIARCKEHFNGIPIGPGRGSGAGSIACYLSGITELEPTSLNLLFERFLSPTRVSMPDIDTDFSKEARAFAISYVQEKYGAKAVAGIMTKTKMGPKSALTYAPKLLAMKNGLPVQTYQQEGITLRAICGDAKHLADIKDEVEEKFTDNDIALTIYKYACLIEGQITSTGQHAAGNIVIQSDEVENYIPLMMAEDDDGEYKMTIQADMVEAEAQLGFIKFDYLGVAELNVLSKCADLIKKHYGKDIDFYDIKPDDPTIYKKVYAEANTNFVFQFEGEGMKKMLKQLNPTNFGDIILGVSVYRPGPMDFIPDIIDCKNTGKVSPIVERIPMLKDILNETYGFPVYQEQVMQIMTKAGGYDLGHADDVRRFMSKKKKDKLEAEEPTFVKGCIANGIKESDAKWLFEQLKPFAEYGFNKSHAAAYSLVSYLTAWCKHYYPEEYLCAAMSARGEKTLQFLNDCKLYGIEVLPVDINTSDADFSVEEKGKIRIGLSAIKGLSSDANVIVEARKDGFYKSIEDIIKRVKIKANVFKALILAGACDTFNDNREAALEFATRYSEVYSEYVTAKEKVDLYTAENKKDTLAKWIPRYKEAEKQLDSIKMRISNPLSTEARLAYESLYLGMWVTGSPLEDYDTENPKYISIEELNIGDYVKTIGVITDYRKFKTKKGDTMAAFTILDKDSVEIKCVLYPKNYESLDIELADNMVIELDGEMSEWDDESQIDVFKVKSMKAAKKSLLLRCGLIKYVEDIEPIVERHMIQNGGMELRIILNGQLRECKAHVSDDIISEIEKLDVEYSVA